MDITELNKDISKIKIQVMRDPNSVFISTILMSLKQVWDDTLNPPTASVDGITLKIHPDFWMALSSDVKKSVLLHEAWHVAFNHTHIDGLDPERHNIAADHVINNMLRDTGTDIPNTWYCDPQYRKMSTMQVYDLLPATPPPPPNSSNAPFTGDIGYPEGGSDSEQGNNIKQNIEELLVKAHTMSELQGKGVSDLPGDVQIVLEELLNPKLDWRTILRNYMSAYSKNDYSLRKPNRRFLPDFYLPSLYSEGVGELAIAVDTSGSVSDTEFKTFLTEINSIKENLNPTLTTIIDFDTSIKHVHKIGQDEDIKNLPFSGRGGTSLTCVFDYYHKHSPEVLIVFSDLECREITKDPGYPVIWICCGNPNATVNFGTLIHYELN